MRLRVDPYRAHRAIFDAVSMPQLLQAFRQITGQTRQAGFTLSPDVFASLYDGFFQTQQLILVFGVQADLELFSKNLTLYDKNLRPADIDKIINGQSDRQKANKTGKKSPSALRSHKQALNFYCERIIGTGLPHEKQAALMGSFFKRNPNVEKLLDISSANFINNLRLCIERISKDKQAIETCFLDGKRIERLADIISTGSDSHKGGKSVLILEFVFGQNQHRRVVYKPSDIEIDYRMVGANTPAVESFLKAHAKDSGYPQYSPSLYELLHGWFEQSINHVIAEHLSGREDTARKKFLKARIRQQLALPTYVMLPRNPGSRLKQTAGEEGIRSSYGYIEYLTHEPQPPDVLVRHQRPGQDSDWTVDIVSDAQVAFRLWGRIGALAWLFEQTDLHQENRILSRRQPHFIDLENMLVKPISTLSKTMVFDKWHAQHSAGRTVVPSLASGGPPNNAIPISLAFEPKPKDYAKDQLYEIIKLTPHNTWRAEHLVYYIPEYCEQLSNGIRETFYLIQAHQQEIKQWLKEAQLQNVIVRDVVQATADLMESLEKYVSNWAQNRIDPISKLAKNIIPRRQAEEINQWDHGSLRGPAHDPYRRAYALETSQYNGRDLANLDIPSYYRRIGDRELLDSSGEPVKFLKREFDKAGSRKDLDFDAFFPDTGIEMLNKKLQNIFSHKDIPALVAEQLSSINVRNNPNSTSMRATIIK